MRQIVPATARNHQYRQFCAQKLRQKAVDCAVASEHNRQIGSRMGLAEKTVKNYTSHLLAKLGLERRTQAAILATELRDRPQV